VLGGEGALGPQGASAEALTVADFICEGSGSTYFGGHTVSVELFNSAIVVQRKHRQYVNKWA